MLNVSVNATGAYAGFDGLPGRNSVTGNIEVVGGRVGILNRGSVAGARFAEAVRLRNPHNQCNVHILLRRMMRTGWGVPSCPFPSEFLTVGFDLTLGDEGRFGVGFNSNII